MLCLFFCSKASAKEIPNHFLYLSSLSNQSPTAAWPHLFSCLDPIHPTTLTPSILWFLAFQDRFVTVVELLSSVLGAMAEIVLLKWRENRVAKCAFAVVGIMSTLLIYGICQVQSSI